MICLSDECSFYDPDSTGIAIAAVNPLKRVGRKKRRIDATITNIDRTKQATNCYLASIGLLIACYHESFTRVTKGYLLGVGGDMSQVEREKLHDTPAATYGMPVLIDASFCLTYDGVALVNVLFATVRLYHGPVL